MKKNILLAVVLTSLAIPAFAQTRSVDIIARGSYVDPNGEGTLDRNNLSDLDIDFDSEIGVGLGLNVFLSNRISAEFAASVVEPEVALRSNNPLIPALSGGALEMIPITGTLQFHFAPDARFSPYIGAGVAYVLFDELNDSSDLDSVKINAIDFDDDAGFVANAGFNFDITPRFALNFDAKYVPVNSAATAVFASGPGTNFEIEINPLILSAGLGFQF